MTAAPVLARAVDADPSLIVSDFLTNAQYGVGFPQASISGPSLFGSGGDASYQTYCRTVGLSLSPALTDQEQASSILKRWLGGAGGTCGCDIQRYRQGRT